MVSSIVVKFFFKDFIFTIKFTMIFYSNFYLRFSEDFTF